MMPTNQIAGFFNEPYLQNKSVKNSLIFFHVDPNSHKSKIKNFLDGCGQNWLWPAWILKLTVSQEYTD